MRSKMIICALALTAAATALIVGHGSGHAQNAREAEMIGFHQMCDRGDRKACIRFGIMIGEARERHAEWRKSHPEFWWWER